MNIAIFRSTIRNIPSSRPRKKTQFERRQRLHKATGVMLVAGRLA